MALETYHYVMIVAVLLTLKDLVFQTSDSGESSSADVSDVHIGGAGSKLASIKPIGPTLKFLYW